MSEMTVPRKQRLRTLENQIRKNYEAFVQTGFALKEIRDDRLYEEDGFESWQRYLKERVGQDFEIEEAQVRRLIVCAQVRIKLPDLSSNLSRLEDKTGSKLEWGPRQVLEFARLAPKDESAHGQPFDLDNLNKRDVERVAKKVIDHCEEEQTKPTSTIVRKFVDEELGIDRAEQAKETKRQREEDWREKQQRAEEERHPRLERYLNDLRRQLHRDVESLRKEFDEEALKRFSRDNPGLITRVIAACTSLADLLRKFDV